MLKYGSHIKKEGIWSFQFLDNAHYISEKNLHCILILLVLSIIFPS